MIYMCTLKPRVEKCVKYLRQKSRLEELKMKVDQKNKFFASESASAF